MLEFLRQGECASMCLSVDYAVQGIRMPGSKCHIAVLIEASICCCFVWFALLYFVFMVLSAVDQGS